VSEPDSELESASEANDETWENYAKRATERAMQLGNRGPVRLDKNGRLTHEIRDAYYRNGFYVFTNVLDAAEVADLAKEFDELLDNAPVTKDGTTDRHGRVSRFAGYYTLAEPQSEDAPAAVGMLSHPLIMMESALRVVGHPKILKMAEGLYGPDFVPFHEGIFHKAAGDGLPTGWHQDGRTHWTEEGDSEEQADGSGEAHGFNLSVSWSNCTAENCLWVVPGSHRHWRLADGGSFPLISERIPDAVPMLLAPGDCGLVSRSSLHGSYPNRSNERRVTMVVGFHKRSSAIGATTVNVHAFKLPGAQSKEIQYSEDYVLRRARMIPLTIDARRQHYPDEVPYEYKGSYLGSGVWNEQTRAEISCDGEEYWQQDITL